MRDELGRVRSLLKQANEQHEEFSAKLRAIDGELNALRDQARREGEAAKQRMLTEAQKLSATIVADSKVAAQGLFNDLKANLRAEIGSTVLARAETLMHLAVERVSYATERQQAFRRLDFERQGRLLALAGQATSTAFDPEGIGVSGFTVDSDGQVRATLTIGAQAALGQHSLSVATASGPTNSLPAPRFTMRTRTVASATSSRARKKANCRTARSACSSWPGRAKTSMRW